MQREVVLCGDVSMNNPAFSEVSFLARCIAAYAEACCRQFHREGIKMKYQSMAISPNGWGRSPLLMPLLLLMISMDLI